MEGESKATAEKTVVLLAQTVNEIANEKVKNYLAWDLAIAHTLLNEPEKAYMYYKEIKERRKNSARPNFVEGEIFGGEGERWISYLTYRKSGL